MKRNWIHVLTIFLLIFSLLTPGLALPDQSAGATPSDVAGHWAYSYIAKGIQLGFVLGYPDGTFLPDKPVSRAEFAKMVNAALGNMGSTAIAFKDVPSFEWFYNDVSKAVAATYVDGYGDGTFLPNKAISRQEAAVMIARIVPSYGIYYNLNVFNDGSKTAVWAEEYVKKVVGKGYLGAYDDGLLHPEDNLTRAQTAKIICSILETENIVKDPTTIKTNNTLAKNTIYTNSVTISKDLEDGNASFQNCTLLGELFVNGGGKSSITLENSRIAQLNVNKAGSAVRILAKGATIIAQTSTQELCTLETSSLAGGLFGKGFVSVDVKRNADTTFIGSFPLINMTGSKGTARLEGSTVDKLIISSDANTSNVHLDSKSTLTTTDVNAVTAFQGPGTIKHMNANVSGITYETKPTTWTLGKGVTEPKQVSPDLKASFLPDNGATGIAVEVKPTITFSWEIEAFNGDAITASYLKDNLVFKKGSATGTNVDFTAALSANKKIITISPKASLDSKQAYYIGFVKDKYRSISNKEAIPAKSVIFTTLNTATIVSFNPWNDATGVVLGKQPEISFLAEIETFGGKALDPTYLNNNLIFTKTSATGDKVGFTATLSLDKKVITINPTASLGYNQKYYIGFAKDKFRYVASKEAIPEKGITFTTINPIPTVSITPGNSATQVATSAAFTIDFSEAIFTSAGAALTSTYLANNITLIKGASGPNLNTDASSILGNTLTIPAPTGGWDQSASYTITVKGSAFKNLAGNYVAEKTSTFTIFTPPLGDAVLSSLVYSYTTSEGYVLAETSALSTWNISVPVSTASITITASAIADVTIGFDGGTSGTVSLTKTIDFTLPGPLGVTITASRPLYTTTNYTLTFTKTP